MIRTRETSEIPDGIGWCSLCRCYVEQGHTCAWIEQAKRDLDELLPYDADRDGPF